jgi:hypothetical protein
LIDLTAPRLFARPGAAGGVIRMSGLNQIPPPQVTKSINADGTVHATLKVPMMAYTTIAGKVTDPYGMPMVDVPVEVLAHRRPGIPAPLNPQGDYNTINSVMSNDRGEFRIARLEPGTYWVVANRQQSMRSTWQSSFRPTYYPAALDVASAQPLQLAAGQQAHTDIQILNQSGVHIAGHFILPSSAPGNAGARQFTSVALTPVNNVLMNSEAPATQGQDNFEFQDVLPGKYTLTALTRDAIAVPGPNQKGVFGLTKEVEIGQQDIAGFDLTLEPLKDLAGTVAFREGCAAAPVTVHLQGFNPLGGGSTQATTDSSGRFVLSGVPPGRFSLVVRSESNPGPLVVVSSAQRGGRDVLKDGLEGPVKGDDALNIVVDCRNPGRRQ